MSLCQECQGLAHGVRNTRAQFVPVVSGAGAPPLRSTLPGKGLSSLDSSRTCPWERGGGFCHSLSPPTQGFQLLSSSVPHPAAATRASLLSLEPTSARHPLSPDIPIANSLISVPSSLKSHLLREASPTPQHSSGSPSPLPLLYFFPEYSSLLPLIHLFIHPQMLIEYLLCTRHGSGYWEYGGKHTTYLFVCQLSICTRK